MLLNQALSFVVVFDKLEQDFHHRYVLIWMVIGLLEEGGHELNTLCHVETEAAYAQSTQRRFSRWLHNIRIHPGSIYRNLIHKALS